MTPNSGFKVTVYYKLNISKTVRLRDKHSYYRTLIGNHTHNLSNITTFNDLNPLMPEFYFQGKKWLVLLLMDLW